MGWKPCLWILGLGLMLKFSSVLEESISEGSVNMLCIEGGQGTRILCPKNANTLSEKACRTEFLLCLSSLYGVTYLSVWCGTGGNGVMFSYAPCILKLQKFIRCVSPLSRALISAQSSHSLCPSPCRLTFPQSLSAPPRTNFWQEASGVQTAAHARWMPWFASPACSPCGTPCSCMPVHLYKTKNEPPCRFCIFLFSSSMGDAAATDAAGNLLWGWFLACGPSLGWRLLSGEALCVSLSRFLHSPLGWRGRRAASITNSILNDFKCGSILLCKNFALLWLHYYQKTAWMSFDVWLITLLILQHCWCEQ